MSGKGGGERSGEYHAETEMKDEKRKVFPRFTAYEKCGRSDHDGGP
jgi:hypothetical protein